MNKNVDGHINLLADHLFRENHGKMVSLLCRQYGHQEIDNVLDSIQEAFEAALSTWKYSGIPANQFAWLYKVSSNKLINRLKSADRSNSHSEQVAHHWHREISFDEKEIEDSMLHLLIFFSGMDFSLRNKLILSLYFLCGFGYVEIANALLLKTETVKKVIARSKATIKQYAGRYDDFEPVNVGIHRSYLLRIIYLLFNEGYKTSKKKGMIQYELCYEAIRLGKLLHNHDPTDVETNALLALMFFNTARFPSRVGEGIWISLEDQDRSLWDRALIREGFHYLSQSKNAQPVLCRYYLEALVSSMHCVAPDYEKTDWKTIAFLYRQLETLEPDSCSLKLNRIISEIYLRSLSDLIRELDTLLVQNRKEHLALAFYSSKAYIYSKHQKKDLAVKNYYLALRHAGNQTDINFINNRIETLRPQKVSSQERIPFKSAGE